MSDASELSAEGPGNGAESTVASTKVRGTGSRGAFVHNECDSTSPKHKKRTKLFGLSDNPIIQKWGKFLFLHLCTRDWPR